MTVLSAKDLSRDYVLGPQTVHALDIATFQIEQGEFVAVMGPSGSGKSTLLHLLGGLDRPTSGEVTVAGKQISLLTDREITLVRRRNIGFVFQFFNLLPTLNTEENILLPLLIDGQKIALFQERLDHLLKMVGLTNRRDHKPDQLSGGEQQRVALARALITEPAIVLADEPTGNLDSKTGIAMMQLFRKSCKERKQAIIMVTHDPKAASYADRIVFLRDGCEIDQLVFSEDESLSIRLRRTIAIIERLEE